MFARLTRSIRNNIIVGMILVIPIAVTGFLARWLYEITTNLVLSFVPRGVKATYPLVLTQAIALLLLLMALFMIGVLARNFLGRRLYQLGDMLLGRIPVLNKIYVSVRQISEALLDQSQNLFKDVVLIEYPRRGVYSLGFITGHVPPHTVGGLPSSERQKEFVSVFVPTSPNPTSGLIIFVPREDTYHIAMSVADAMKLIVSGGAVFPGVEAPDSRPTLLDKLEKWIAKQGSKVDGRQTHAGDEQALPGSP